MAAEAAEHVNGTAGRHVCEDCAARIAELEARNRRLEAEAADRDTDIASAQALLGRSRALAV